MATIWRFTWRIALALVMVIAVILLTLRWMASQREIQEFGALPAQGGQIVSTAQGGIYLLSRGDASNTPVLFAHGTAAWSGLWLPTLETIGEQGYNAISFDMPPFGFSQHAMDFDYSRQRQADRILALVDSLAAPPIVVAHSIGAGPVAEAVLRSPESFAGFIIVDGAIGLNSHMAPKGLPFMLRNATMREIAISASVTNPYATNFLLRQLIFVKDAADQPVLDVLSQPMSRAGYTVAVGNWLPTLLQPPVNALSTQPEHWQTLPIKTTIIWGDQDTVTPLAQGQELTALIPNAELVVLPNVGHIPQIEAPELFQNALLAALNKSAPIAKE